MNLNDYNFNLPEKLIAQSFKEKRDHSKLMVIDNGKVIHKKFFNIISTF